MGMWHMSFIAGAPPDDIGAPASGAALASSHGVVPATLFD
jgi:hypothetical protein